MKIDTKGFPGTNALAYWAKMKCCCAAQFYKINTWRNKSQNSGNAHSANEEKKSDQRFWSDAAKLFYCVTHISFVQ